MELLDRYLHAVGNNLPPKKRDDILRELRGNILEGVEEKEAALGRRLTLEEEEDVLKAHGHPAVVGMRYWPKQYLIGPSLFPYFLAGLKTVVPLALLLYCIVNAVVLAAQSFNPQRLFAAIMGIPGVLFTTAAWVTLAFVVVEYVQAHWPQKLHLFDQWSPRTLPSVPATPTYSSWRAAGEVIASGGVLVWFLLVPHFPFLMFGPAAQQLTYVTLAPQWTTFYWAFMGILFVQWLAELAGLVLPRLRPLRPVLGILGRVATAVLFGLMTRVPVYLWLNDAGHAAHRPTELVDALNTALRIGLRAMVAIFVVTLIVDLARKAVFSHAQGSSVDAGGKLLV